MSAERLQRALRALGLEALVGVRDGVALLQLNDPALLSDRGAREAVVALAAEHGFRSVAVEVGGAAGGAPLRRD